jgi:glycosyltransferase involved in cell wall biosynthesis
VTIGTLHIDIEGGWGGSSRSLYELVKRLDRNEVSPVVVHRLEGPVSEWYASVGIPSYHVPEIGSFVPRRKKATRNFIASLPRLTKLDAAANRIIDIAGRHDSKVIHLNYEGLFLLASRLRKKSDLPMIGHSRAHLPQNGWARWLARKLSANVDYMFFISPQEKARWCELVGAECVPGEVLWNIARAPLPRQPFAHLPEVVYLGNLERSKGPNRIIDIAAAVAARVERPPFVFAIYGRTRSSARYMDVLEKYRASKGMEEWVEFRGHTSAPEPVLARAFALVRPSYENDPWGRDVIEALAAGVPVLATGTFTGVVQPGVSGYLFETFDPDAFADRLLALHGSKELWRRMSDAGKAFAAETFGGSQQVAIFTRALNAVRR